ncbi:AraC family transcriptional regulator [Aliiruegeria lutimaris]|uniref:AraC-type DNA-binding protein n=1 Tax=Aliiruegeria lutimaris TaxID=571298 RepID=A0A1G9Q322_9RHOB|nr:AraC family transcriptional regulator [Aliiruegeria lutimaris]SDM04887.1 AraC-type DNA-binding protein [Aliiruegeria lutimaris]
MTTLRSMTVAEALGSVPDLIASKLGDRVLEKSLSAAGLPEDISFRVGHYIPEVVLNRLLDAAARSAGDDLFGLTFTDHLSIKEYGAWGDYVLEAPNLWAALKRAKSIMYLHANNDRLELRVGATTSYFEYTFGEKELPGYRHVALAALGPMLSVPRHFKGPNWRPVSVGLDFGAGRSKTRLETGLGTRVRCGEACISLEMKNKDLYAPNPEAFTRRTTRGDVVRACGGGPPRGLVPFVEQLIIQGLGNDKTSLDDIACLLATSKRSFQRQLDQEGTNFRAICNIAKMRRAAELLVDTRDTVTEIAMLLNYSTPSHFARAFRQVYGISPFEFRSVHVANAN